jgi:ribonuclease D
MGGRFTFPGGGAYHATKHAVESVSDALRFEVAGFGIDVVLIEPGIIRTSFSRTAVSQIDRTNDGGPYGSFNAAVAKATAGVYERGLMRRLGGGPETVARAIENALTAARPRARYTVTPSAKVMIAQRRLLPDAAWDRLIATQFPRPARTGDERRRPSPRSPAAHVSSAGWGSTRNSCRRGRYRPLLCLVQVVVGEEIVLLDPLDGDGFDPSAARRAALRSGRSRSSCTPGRQDVAILRREWRCDVTNLFDTQVAAGFAGFSAQAGYLGLLHDVLKIKLAKSASFTRWDARPLTQEQLSYAREDVEHLLALTDELQTRLEARGRLDWAREECRAVADVSDERDPDEVWRRLPRSSGLAPRERAVARELAAWRERTAERENRPVGGVLRDPTVVELAKRTPLNVKALGQIRGLPSDVIRRRGRRHRRRGPRGRAASRSCSRTPSAAGQSPRTPRPSPWPRRSSRPRARRGPGLRARRGAGDLTPVVVAARRGRPEPDVRTCRAGAGRWWVTSCSPSWTATGRSRVGTAGASRIAG